MTVVSSYNWTRDQAPTIVVPGSPPLWTNKPLSFKLTKDSGLHYIDKNAYCVPKSPLAPLIVAVEHSHPDYNWANIDIISDRNGLRKLLRWIEGTLAERDFRINLQLVGQKTVLFGRWEPKYYEYGGRGYGHNFERETTRAAKGCENTAEHHRIISYVTILV